MEKGIYHDFLDRGLEPGEDFYQFVNGGWMRSTEIPPDRSSWGSFHELSKSTDQKVLSILERELSTPGPAENKAARLFETGMDQESIEHAKLSAIDGLFGAIEKVGDKSALPQLLGMLSAKGYGAFLQFSVHPDLGDSNHYAAYVEAANLGLPERDFYLDQDEKAAIIREKYLGYITALLGKEANYTEAQAKEAAATILSIESQLASKMISKEERRQIDKLYNPHNEAQLTDLVPDWDWTVFFQAQDIAFPDKVIVTEPAYCSFFNTYIGEIPLEAIKQYLTFLLIHHSALYGHKSLERAHFELFTKELEGTEVMRPRSERIVRVINQTLGQLLGQLFVSEHFPPSAKQTALEMTGDIVEAFRNRILNLQWMSESTRQYAVEKLAAFKVKIGYPDTWEDFSDLQIEGGETGGNYLGNMISVVEWNHKRDVGRIGKKVDRDEWFMAPQVVNAYYNPMFNEIVFPAAILQPPFFDWEADAAVNYGGIGAVIGHEITHGFDDQGSRFDKNGNLSEWWTPEDRERFAGLTSKLVEQFDAYSPFEDLSVNGTFTLGENIADLGGLSVAYDALQLYYLRHGRPGLIGGFTPEQRFFMSWATVWRTKIRPEALRNQIKTDPHPPGMYRAVAAPSNMDSFYYAFHVIPGSKWFRHQEERIKIW